MDGLVTSVLIFMLGAAVGSFLNVVIYRLPAGLSLLHPPSRCPKCQTRLKPYDNVPVFGWLWLRGRCRYCRAPIAARYPLIEALVGLLFWLTFWLVGLSWWMVAGWLLLSWLVALTFIDLDTLTLPNALTQSGLVLGLLVRAGLSYLAMGTSDAAINGFVSGLVGMVLGIWLFDLITLAASVALGQTAMGGGDAKLAAMLGAWLGWQGVLLSSFLACVVGAVIGSGAIALGLVQRRQPIPFGPFLALGAIVTLFWGEALLGAYRAWFFPS